MRRLVPARYFVASVLLLSALLVLLGVSTARRTRQELARQLEQKGRALAETVEIASRSAIEGNALVEEMIAQRLLDNARLIDELGLARSLDPETLAGIRAANRLRRVDLVDRDGRPWTRPPRPPRGMMMGPMMPGPGGGPSAEPHREMMRFFWGRRWGGAPADAGGAPSPAPIRDRRFWEGTVFGVAIGARSFPGIIAVHADAAYVLDFRKRIGVERQVEELGRQSGVEAVALLSPELTVLAHSDPRRIGAREDDPALVAASREHRELARLARRPDGVEVFQVVRPLALDGSRRGLLRIDLSLEPVREAWRRDLRSAALLGLSVLLLGGVGLAVIFYTQNRHLAEVRALEAEVERRERLAALGNLAAVVGHEVRNPLNAISVGLQRLRQEFQPADDAAGYARLVDLAQGEVRRLDRIVEEFLSLARPLPLAPAPMAPGALLEEVAALVDDEARSRGVRVLRRVPGDLSPTRLVPLDRDRMKEVLLNLARNGLDAMPHGGDLTLGAAPVRDGVVLTVEDTGEGVPAELLPRIFDPWVTTKTTGMGLGLAIARRIVEGHGGRIAAESRAGEGTRFTITLPLTGPRRA